MAVSPVVPNENLQNAFIEFMLGGGTLQEMVRQLRAFGEGLQEIEPFDDRGAAYAALVNFDSALAHAQWLASKADRAGVPDFPPHMLPAKPAPAPAPAPAPVAPARPEVLVEVFGGCVSNVRSSVGVDVWVWDHEEVREGCVPARLLSLEREDFIVLEESQADFPETKKVGGVTLYLLRVDGKVRFDRNGRPVYCSVPDRDLEVR